jgi:hypothetical protein
MGWLCEFGERDGSDSKRFQKVIIKYVQDEPFHIL